ncbi:MAG: hypothetical protein AAF492_21050, partial [Verrucomicrobiota bacterium]
SLSVGWLKKEALHAIYRIPKTLQEVILKPDLSVDSGVLLGIFRDRAQLEAEAETPGPQPVKSLATEKKPVREPLRVSDIVAWSSEMEDYVLAKIQSREEATQRTVETKQQKEQNAVKNALKDL